MPDDCPLQVKHPVCWELKKNDNVCCNWWLIYYLLSKCHNGMSKINFQASFMVLMISNKQVQKRCHISYLERKKYSALHNKIAEVMIVQNHKLHSVLL